MAQIDLGQATIEMTKTYRGVINMFVSGAANRVEDADRGQKSHGFARGRQQLFDGGGVIAGFSKHLVVEYGQLVSADDQGVASIDRNCLGFFPRQVAGQFARRQSFFVTFVDVRRHRLILRQETVQQAAPVLRRGGEENRWRGGILHKIKNLARTRGSLTGARTETDAFLEVSFDSGRHGPYHARAMGNPLLQRRAPLELAAVGQTIEFNIKISEFERLNEAVARELVALDRQNLPRDWRDAVVSGRLQFAFADAQGSMPVVTGHAAVSVWAVCQRCLKPFSLPLQAELKLVLGEHGYDTYELWELDDGMLCPADLVDEALVMALPFAAKHDVESECVAVMVAETTPATMRTPFANLKSQMGKEN